MDPLLPPFKSFALPSPGNQLTMLAGVATQAAAPPPTLAVSRMLAVTSLLTILRVPVWAPCAVAENRTVTVVCPPAGTVKGVCGGETRVNRVRLEEDVEIASEDRLSAPPPVLRMVNARSLVCP